MNIEIHSEEFRGTWQECMDYAKGLGDGWRVPEIWELVYICHKGLYDTDNHYWSSTTSASNTMVAWYVHFGSSYVIYGYKANINYAHCIRDIKLHMEYEGLKNKTEIKTLHKALELACQDINLLARIAYNKEDIKQLMQDFKLKAEEKIKWRN